MSFVPSNWKITFDHGGASAAVLVDFGDELDDEISFPWTQAVETVQLLGAATVRMYARGGSGIGFTVGLWKTHASQVAARNYLLAHAAALPLGAVRTLRIEVYGGASYTLSTAVIASGDGRILATCGPVRTWVQYKIEGGKFTIV